MTDVADSLPTPRPTELTREYVASSSDGASVVSRMRDGLRSLPYPVDALEAELGDDSYGRMLTDPQVASADQLLRESIREDGVQLTPAETPEGDEAAAQQAADIAAFVERCLDGLTTPLDDVLWDMLECIAFGARVAELVYTVPADGDDRGRYVLSAIKPKPRPAIAFVVDAYLNIVGFLGAKPGQSRVFVGGTLSPAQRAEVLPREKFAVLTWRPKNGDPRGSSQLRPAYNPWWIKQQEWPEFVKVLFQFATPSVYGITGEKAQGKVIGDTEYSPEDLLLSTLVNLQNGSASALAPGTVIGTIEAGEGAAAAFDTITSLLNREITTGILGTTRTTMEAENGSRADSQTSKSLFDSLVRAGRATVARMLQRDVVDRLVELNFGKAALPLAPRVAVGGIEEEDKTGAWTAAAQLERAGYLDPSQYEAFDAELGLPVRSAEDAERRAARKAAPPVPPPAVPVVPGQEQGQTPPPPASEPGDEGDEDEEGGDGA